MTNATKILIIDDNEDDRDLFKRTLKGSDGFTYEIAEAESGEAGLAIIGEASPACVLLDYSLPGHNGIEVLRYLRSKYPFVPVVMLTGQGNENIAVRAMQEGAQNYISKATITAESLQGAIRVAIDHCAMECRIHAQHEALEKRAHELAEQKRLLAQAQSMAHIANWRMFASSGVFEWSDELYAICGVDRDFLPKRRNVQTLIHEEDRRRVCDAIDRAIETQEPFRADFRFVRPDGSVRECSAEGHWERGETPKNVLVGYCQDVTESKALAEQLHQAQKMEILGQLTGGIAHDFNNLLTVVISNLDMMIAKGGASPEHIEMAETALSASLRGAELTRQLLAFSRKQNLRRRTIDPNEIVTRTVTMLKRTLAGNIDLRTNLAADIWPSDIDPAQLEAAITNLIVNARDAMANGGTIVVETGNTVLDEDYAMANREVSPGEYVLISVSDTGSGIPPDVLPRVFEPFFTTKDVGKGTGLGLSMVYGFLKQSGGHVKIYSEQGQGTVVRLYLPKSDSGPSALVSEPDSAGHAAEHETILVVEDDNDVRHSTSHLLKELGYRILEAESPRAALAVLEREHVDLLFTDMVMPGGMSGLELARQATAGNPRLKVLMTSGFTELAMRENELAAKFELLSKPYRRQELAQRIFRALRGT